MSEIFAALGIFIVAGLWFMAPFFPAIAEWRQKRDARPLRVVQDYEGEVSYFAQGFRAYIDDNVASVDVASVSLDGDAVAEEGDAQRLADGAPYLVVTEQAEPALTDAERHAGYTERVLLARGAVSLPGRMAYLREIYARGHVHGEYNNIYRALLGDEDIELGAESMILRWLHAAGDVHIGASSVLYGRLSARGRVTLERGCRFARLNAAQLQFGAEPAGNWGAERKRSTFRLDGVSTAELAARRWLVRRGLDIPPGSRFRGDLVVYGPLAIGEGSIIEGSVKAHGDLKIGRGTHIEGSVIGVGDVDFEPGCSLRGPVLGEKALWIAEGCRLGMRVNPTTVSAPRIVINSGVVAYGTVWAREHGELRQ